MKAEPLWTAGFFHTEGTIIKGNASSPCDTCGDSKHWGFVKRPLRPQTPPLCEMEWLCFPTDPHLQTDGLVSKSLAKWIKRPYPPSGTSSVPGFLPPLLLARHSCVTKLSSFRVSPGSGCSNSVTTGPSLSLSFYPNGKTKLDWDCWSFSSSKSSMPR